MARELTHGEKAVQPKHGLPDLDETVPGGWYVGEDGVPHDAHGNVLKNSTPPKAAVHEVTEADHPVVAVAAVAPPVAGTPVVAKKAAAKKSGAKKK